MIQQFDDDDVMVTQFLIYLTTNLASLYCSSLLLI